MMDRKLIMPKVTADPAAMFFEDENPQEAALHEIQYENARVLCDALIHRDDFQAAQYSTPEGSQRILHHSPRDGVDWQLSYVAPDGIPTMHGDFLEDGHDSPHSGRTMRELMQDLSTDNARTVKEITLLLADAEKGDRNVDERTSSFIADIAKLYALNNRTPIDPEADLFRAFERRNGTVDRAEYNQVLTDTLMTGAEPPKVAVLQPVMDGLIFRPYSDVIRNDDFRAENYNLIYRTDAPEIVRMNPEQIFEHFNSPALRPGDYYGTSISVGDIVVTENAGEFKAHFVDRIGMRELPEDFLDTQTRQKILYGLDVRQERDLLQRYVEFVSREGIDLDVTQETERISQINGDYERSFAMADIRTVLQNHQNTLETIYDFQEESGIDYGVQYFDGTYTIRLTGERENNLTAENYQTEINNRLARAAQQISEGKENVWRMEANPGYRGNAGEYPFFVQRYRAAEPGHLIPEEVSFLGDAESASYFMNHINARTLLGEALQENVSMRQSLNMPPLEGNIDTLLITDVEMENLDLSDRMREQTARLHRAMRAAGFREEEPVAEESHIYYSLRRPVSIGTYPTEGMVQFENYDSRTYIAEIGQEAWGKLTYSRELTPQELASYELAPDTPQITPIREFFDEDGRILVGSDIGLDRETGQVNRRRVYQAVQIFEDRNRNLIQAPVIDRNGDYLDREFLYSAYNRYVGMSNRQDSDLAPFRELIENAADMDSRNITKAHLQDIYTAEVYFAHRNGLNQDQIEYMVVNSAGVELPSGTSLEESMTNIRHAFEQGMTEEQVDLIIGQESFVQQEILAYLYDGGDMERARAVRGADMDTSFYLMQMYREHNLSPEKAAAFVRAANTMEQALPDKTARTHSGYEANVQILSEYAVNQSITPESMERIAADFAAQTWTNNLRRFIEQGGGIERYYPDNKNIVQVQAAVISRVPGYVVLSQYDRDVFNSTVKVFLGKEENYENPNGRYNNADNSLIHVSDNGKMASFLSAGQGWVLSQQQMIDNGTFTAEDYREYDRIRREVLPQLPEVTNEVRFSIGTDREGSGVPFTMDWQNAQERPHSEDEKERSNQNMADEQQERTTTPEGITQPEEKKSAKDELSEQLMQGVRSIMESDNYKNWLATSNSYFTNSYSFNNAVLIFMQKPDATYVKSYEAWKDFGRNVGQGAKGAQIFVPVMAYDKTEGALYRMIMSNLRNQIKQNPGQIAAFKVGMSNLEFTMNGNGQIGLRVKGQEKGIFASEQEVKRFISSSILGKVPMYYTVGRVFDVKDTIVPEHLWVKKGYTKDEVVKDKDGKPIKNKRGEVKIVNTPERQARFQPTMTQDIQSPKDTAKMAILYDVLKTVSARNGIPVTDVPRETDENLKGGADGYFSRQFSTENPKGFIVMPDDLEPTRKVAVLMHEMGHSDLHGNLAKLAAQMGEDKIPRHMREIQAESVAYATARQFGIETDTSSFQYLAVYSQGFELQDLKKSLDVVYAECKKLTQEISAELDARGLNLDLSEKEVAPMEKSTIDTLCKQYTAYALEQSETVQTQLKELPSLAADNRSNPDLLSVVMEQSKCMDRQMAAVDAIHESVKALQGATTREEQNAALDSLEASRRSIEGEKETFAGLTTSFAEISSQSKATVKEEFARDPMATLESMKKEYPALASLSAVQLGYIAKSEYIRKEYGNLLKTDPAQFVKKAAARAEALDKAISKNGTFVEVNFCEQWTDKPIVQSGAIMHPKVADTIIKQAEVQIRGLKTEAEKAGDYFPYNKCDLTVFSKDGKDLTAYRTRVDIGDNAQTSLSDHLKQLCGEESTLYAAFDKATRERGAKEKIVFNEAPEVATEKPERGNEPEIAEASTHAEWANAIAQEKSGTQTQEAAHEPDKTVRKDNKEH